MSDKIQNNLIQVLACPNCKGSLSKKEGLFFCKKCKRNYEIQDSVPIFLKTIVQTEDEAEESYKKTLTKKPGLFKILKKVHSILGPPGTTYYTREVVKEKWIKKSLFTLNIGSSSKKKYPHSINLDIGPYDGVDVVADGKQLPFKNNVFDLILLESVLEHVDEAEKVIKESFRVLKKGGRIYIAIPFVFVFHGSPNDFNRYTLKGLEFRLKNEGFSIESSGIVCGPSSTLAQTVRYYLAMLFSFNSDFLFSFWLNVFGWLTFWVKYLDIFMAKHKKAHLLASAIYACGKK